MRRLIPNLQPGTNYAIQVRATNGSEFSEWSPLFEVTTIEDTANPNVPANVTWVSSGDSFHGEWDAVTTNTDGETVPITRYEIELVASATTRFDSVVQATGAKVVYDLSFEANRALFGTPRGSVALRVRAVDNKGLKSAWTTAVTAQNAVPDAPTNVVATAGPDEITLNWTASPSTDVIGYNVYHETTKIGFINGTTYRYVTSTYSSQTLKVAAVDRFGQESTIVSANAVTPVSPFVSDTTAPAAPVWGTTTLANNPSGVGAVASLAWTQTLPNPNDLAGFEIRYREGTNAWTSAGTWDAAATSAVVEVPKAYTAYEFAIRSFDQSRNYSGWVAKTLAAVANTRPDDVGEVTSTFDDTSITFKWPASANTDLKSYRVEFADNSSYTNATVFDTGLTNSLTVSGLTPSTTYYMRVKAVDQGGLDSLNWSTRARQTAAAATAALSDGNPPASSPGATVTGGIGYLHVSWLPVANNDPVTYEIHLSTTSTFTPTLGASATKVGEVAGTQMTIEKDAAGAALTYGVIYYVRIIAKDRDTTSANAPAAGAVGQDSLKKNVIGDLDLNSITPSALGTVPVAEYNGLVAYSKETRLNVSKVNNTSRTGTLDNWTGAGSSAVATLSVENDSFNGVSTIKAMKATSSGDSSILSDLFEVDPTKAYEFTIWLKDTADVGTASQLYFGAYAYNNANALASLTWVLNSTGAVSSTGSNFYFMSTSSPTIGSYVEYKGYILPYGTDPSFAKGLGKNVNLHGIMGPDTVRLRMRFLNWSNAGTPRDVYAAHMTVVELPLESVEARGKAVTEVKSLWGHPSDTTLIDGGDIYTNSIRAKSMVLLDVNNYLSDPNFTDSASWSLDSTATIYAASGTTPGYLLMNARTASQNWHSGDANWWGTEPGDTYHVTCEVYGETANTGTTSFGAYLQTTDAAGTTSGGAHWTSPNLTTIPNGVWTTISGVATMPSSAKRFRLLPYINASVVGNKIRVRNIKIRRRNGGELIVDGSIQANKMTAGTYTGGIFEIGAGGSFQSALYTSSGGSSGFRLTDQGLIIKSGTVSAATLESGTAIITDLKVNAGGKIESAGYAGGNGWRLNDTGISVIGSGNAISATALSAGTLGNGVGITMAVGSSILLQGGHVRSNTYNGTNSGGVYAANPSGTGSTQPTAGFYLGDDGITIARGRVFADAITGGTFTGGNFVLGSGGTIQSTGYTGAAGSGGFRLTNTGLEIPDGTLSASKLLIQSGAQNLVPGEYASFELTPTWYNLTLSQASGATGTATISTAQRMSGTQSLRIVFNSSTTANSYVEYAQMEQFRVEPNTAYIVSYYVYQEGGVANDTHTGPVVNGDTYRYADGGPKLIPSINGWVRLSWTFTTGASETLLRINPRLLDSGTTARSGRVYYIDGIQVEQKMSAATTPSSFVMNGVTRIDGNMIRTGEIRSTANLSSGTPSWSINTSGAASFSAMKILGNTVLGSADTDTVSQIQSYIYTPGSKGWMIRADGNAEFAFTHIRGKLTVSQLNSELATSLSQVFTDDMSDASRWNNNTGTVITPSVVDFGGTAISYNGTYTPAYHSARIPFDPTALYKVTVRVRGRAGNPVFYAGVRTYQQNAATAISNWYGAASFVRIGVTDEWQEYVGYFKGTSATQTYVDTTAANPGTLPTGTAYFGPLMLPNYQWVTPDTTEVSVFKIEVMSNAETIQELWGHENDTTTIDGGNIYTDTITLDALKAGNLEKVINLANGSSLISTGVMGEKVALGQFGFYVKGPQENIVTSKSSSGTTRTINTAVAHNFAVGQKIVIKIGDPNYDNDNTTKSYTVASVSSATSFTYTHATALTEAAVAVTAGIVQGLNPALGDGQDFITFPTDGTEPNIISGQLTASNVIVSEGMSIRKTSNVEAGAQLIINHVVEAPKIAASLSQTYSDIQMKGYSGTLISVTRGHNGNYFVLAGGSNDFRISEHSTNGAFIANRYTYKVASTAYRIPRGFVYGTPVLGGVATGRYYLQYSYLSRLMYTHTVEAFNTSWASQGTGQIGQRTDGVDPLPKSRIGWDYIGNRLMVGFRGASGSTNVTVRYYTNDATTGVITGAVTGDVTVAYSGSSQLAFVARGPFDYGSTTDQIVIKDTTYSDSVTSGSQYSVATNAGAVDSTKNWPVANNTSIAGAAWDATSGRFIDLNTSGYVRQYSHGDSYWASTTMQDTRWVRYAWYHKGNDVETNLSGPASYSLSKRAKLNVTTAPVPYLGGSTPDHARIYVLDNPTDTFPTVTAYRLRATIPYTTSTATIDPADLGTTGTANATANEFVSYGSSPGQIVSSTGRSFWKGDDTAMFSGLVLTANVEADGGIAANDNKAALRIGGADSNGNLTGAHLRFDANEIMAMSSTAAGAYGTLGLNAGAGGAGAITMGSPLTAHQGATINNGLTVNGNLTSSTLYNTSGSILLNVLNGALRVGSGTNIAGRIATNFTGTAVTWRSNFVAITTDTMNATSATSGNTMPFWANTVNAFAAYNNASDAREKTDIKPVDGKWALATVKNIQINEFKMPNLKEAVQNRKQYGIIAQEVQKVLPTAITEREGDGLLMASYQDIWAVGFAATKELITRVEAAEARADDAEKRMAAMEARMTAIEAAIAGGEKIPTKS